VVEIQQALSQHQWPEDVDVRVRMGLHTGEPIVARTGYVGMDVHRAARIAHVGHGGQVLLSETTAALVMDELPEGVELLDLGRHLLKDIRRPEHIRQLVIEGRPAEFPPLTSLERLPPAELREPRQVGESPYRGLAAFREQDAGIFFGRDGFSQRLFKAVQTKPLVAVIVGASGSGKSSVVYAGLLPTLREEGTWLIATFRPGNQPFYVLAASLLPELDPNLSASDRLVETDKLAERLFSGEINLDRIAQDILAQNPEKRHLLLVIDQFEELYTLCTDGDVQRSFIDELLVTVDKASQQQPHPIVILLTMRADFMGQAVSHRPFADALQEASLIMGPMNREELRSAIEKPGEKQGAAFEPGLVERILDDVGDEPGNLPLLEFALTLLWEEQTDGWLTHEDYEALGCVEGALASYADDVYIGLEESEREGARRIFTQLVSPGEGTQDTRRMATFDEIGSKHWVLVRYLADKRLVVTSRDIAGVDTVEVIHEALIQRWGRFREWIEADRTFRTWQERLRGAMRGWEASDRDEGALLRGAPLVEAESWIAARGEDLTDQEQGFIHASINTRIAIETRRNRRRRRTILGLAAGLVVVLAFAILAGLNAANARREADVNRSLVLAGLAVEADEAGEVDMALALGLEAVDINEPPADAIRNLVLVASGPGTRAVLTGHTGPVRTGDFSPDARQAISGGCVEPDDEGNCSLGELILWDLTTEGEVARWAAHDGWVTHLAWRPGGEEILTAGGDGDMALWDTKEQKVLAKWDTRGGDINSLTFSPDGRLAAAASTDGSVILLDITQDQINFLEGHQGPVLDVAFSPDGKQIVSGSADGSINLWDALTGNLIRTIFSQEVEVGNVEFSADGQRILSSMGFTSCLLDIATGAEIQSWEGGNWIGILAVSPDGRTYLRNPSHLIYIHDFETQAIIQQLQGHAGEILDLAISADGRLALSAASDGTLRIWNLQGEEDLKKYDIGLPADSMAIAPDGDRMAIGSGYDEQAGIWDLTHSKFVQNLDGVLGEMPPGALTSSPDGRWFAAASGDWELDTDRSRLLIWEAATGDIHCQLEDNIRMVRNVAFSPDSRYALSGSMDESNELIVWDVSDCSLVRQIANVPDTTGIEFSADGRTAVTSSAFSENATLWDLDTGQALHVFTAPGENFLDVTFGPSEETVLAAAASGFIFQWDRESGTEVHRFTGHDGVVWSLDISQDEQFLASGDDTGTVILWDLATGEELRRHSAHQGVAFQVAFSPEGGTIYSVSGDETMVAWQPGNPSLPALLDWIERNRYVRQLTCEEREQYDIKPLCK
jgi:WD40 repeat protein